MAGLVPAIHDFLVDARQDVDAQDKPGHDGRKWHIIAARILD